MPSSRTTEAPDAEDLRAGTPGGGGAGGGRRIIGFYFEARRGLDFKNREDDWARRRGLPDRVRRQPLGGSAAAGGGNERDTAPEHGDRRAKSGGGGEGGSGCSRGRCLGGYGLSVIDMLGGGVGDGQVCGDSFVWIFWMGVN